MKKYAKKALYFMLKRIINRKNVSVYGYLVDLVGMDFSCEDCPCYSFCESHAGTCGTRLYLYFKNKKED